LTSSQQSLTSARQAYNRCHGMRRTVATLSCWTDGSSAYGEYRRQKPAMRARGSCGRGALFPFALAPKVHVRSCRARAARKDAMISSDGSMLLAAFPVAPFGGSGWSATLAQSYLAMMIRPIFLLEREGRPAFAGNLSRSVVSARQMRRLASPRNMRGRLLC
jgi:hypothetical protein